MGTSYINGFQKRSGPLTILANAKHYLGDGGTANGVNNANTSGDETALRAIHLAPYQTAVKAGVGSIMASYSSWQGTRMHANATMITGVLKGELGFAGFVGSDYNGCSQNGVNAAGCLERRRRHVHDLRDECLQFRVDDQEPRSRHRPAVAHRRRRTAHPGREMRDGPARRSAASRSTATLTAQVGSAAHRAVARRAVAASLVVLKNDGNALPISKSVARVALGGKTGDNVGNQCGGWTIAWQGMTGAVTTGTTVRQALEA